MKRYALYEFEDEDDLNCIGVDPDAYLELESEINIDTLNTIRRALKGYNKLSYKDEQDYYDNIHKVITPISSSKEALGDLIEFTARDVYSTQESFKDNELSSKKKLDIQIMLLINALNCIYGKEVFTPEIAWGTMKITGIKAIESEGIYTGEKTEK